MSGLKEAVEAARAAARVVESWRSEIAEARGLIGRLEGRVGVEAVERGPERVGELAAEVEAARGRLAAAEAALPVAEGRRVEAVAAACRVEADELEPARVKAVKALESYTAKTEQLLEALRAHSGAEWRRVSAQEFFAANPGGAFRHGKDAPLRAAVEAVERKQALLRGVADGRRPQEVLSGVGWDDLGECLRPGGVADVGFRDPDVAAAEAEAEKSAALEEARAELDAASSGMAAASARLRNEPATVQADEAWQRAKHRLEKARGAWFTAAGRYGVPVGEVEGLPEVRPTYERPGPRVEAGV